MNQRSLDRLKGVKQVLIDILIEASKDTPYPFEIPSFGGLRTAEEQNGLFLRKASTKDGYNKKSNHQLGMAADIYLNKEVKMWDPIKLEKVARHIQAVALDDFKIKLYWGGDWDNDGLTKAQGDKDEKFIDYPHLELR
jgi:peptidoglycan L-alanyl-D-glutamate endopeptidase CwlK